MTNLKISQFANGGAVQTTDEVAANRAGVNTKVFFGSMAAEDAGDYYSKSESPAVFTLITANSIELTSSVPPSSAEGIYRPSNNVIGLSSRGLPAFTAGNVANAVNYINVTGTATGNSPEITSAGDDSNINIKILPKGTGETILYANQEVSVRAGYRSGTGSPVNFFLPQSVGAGFNPRFRVDGSDTNIGFDFTTKGTGTIFFQTNVGTTQMTVTNTASAVNRVQVTGAATGNAPNLSAQGSDSNIDLLLTPKGTGRVRFGSHSAGSLSVTGSIEIRDSGGTIRRLLVG